VGIRPGYPRRQADAFVTNVYRENRERSCTHYINESQHDETHITADTHGRVGGYKLSELNTADPEGAKRES